MVATLNNYVGFETGDANEMVDATGATFQSSGGNSGGRYVTLGTSDVAEILFFEVGAPADAGANYCVGVAIRVDDWSPTTVSDLLHVLESNSTTIVRLRLETNGDITLADTDQNTIQTISPSLSVDEWHYFEIYFANSASGDVEVFIDSVSQGNNAGEDTSGTVDLCRSAGFGADTIDVDDMYCASGLTDSGDRLSVTTAPHVGIKRYGSTKASAVPDDGGDNLNIGTWSAALTVPFSGTVQAEYTGAGAGAVDSNATNGDPEGPLNDSDIGETLAIKGVWRMERSGGGGSAHFGLLGNDSDGTTRSADFDPPTSVANYFFLSEDASIVPETDEYCRIGFETTGGQDFECYGMACMVLFTPPAGGPTTFDGVAQFDGTGTFTASGAVSIAATASFTGVGGFAAIGGRVFRGNTATFTGLGTFAAVGALMRPGVAQFDGLGTFAAVGQTIRGGVARFDGTGTFTANGAATLGAVAQFDGVGGFSAVGRVIRAAVAQFGGIGTFAAVGATKFAATATFAAVGGFTAIGSEIFRNTANFAGVGTFVAIGEHLTGPQTFPGVADFDGVGGFTAVGRHRVAAVANFSGSGGFAAVGATTTKAFATFGGLGSFSAIGSHKHPGVAAFNGAGTFAAIGSTIHGGLASFAAIGTFIADGRAIIGGAALFEGTGGFAAVGEFIQGVTVFPGVATFGGVGTFAAVGEHITDLDASKITGYAALALVPNEIGVTKLAAYAALSLPSGEFGATKITAYAILTETRLRPGVAVFGGAGGFAAAGRLIDRTLFQAPDTEDLRAPVDTVDLRAGVDTETLDAGTDTETLQ